MKITRVSVFCVEFPTKGGGYHRTAGFSPDNNRSTIVKFKTDAGLSGFDEDPFQTEKLNRSRDVKFKDDLYVKAPLDAALCIENEELFLVR